MSRNLDSRSISSPIFRRDALWRENRFLISHTIYKNKKEYHQEIEKYFLFLQSTIEKPCNYFYFLLGRQHFFFAEYSFLSTKSHSKLFL